ncbi:MAG TPA: CADD family putative folate metabolism protein [Candidatus Thermoplasmatota archaeon]
MSPSEPKLVQDLKAVIAKRSVLDHPFYKAWTKGEVTHDALAFYARQYYPHVLAFPTYVSAVHANCPDLATRQEILENLIEEERGPENHPELWLRFAEGLGLDRESVKRAGATASTRAFIGTFQDATRNMSYPAGMAALFAYESQIPEVSRVKIDGLRRFYGVRDKRSLKFFTAHMDLDEVHSEVAAGIIAKRSKGPRARAEALEAATRVADGYWGFLDGVMEATM